jgi:hypothetical protein
MAKRKKKRQIERFLEPLVEPGKPLETPSEATEPERIRSPEPAS